MTQDDMGFTDFLASSIHDMKNSLNIQLNALEKVALQCQERGDTETYDNLGLVIFQASRMNVNLVQMLSLYKLGRSIYPLDITEHSIADVIPEVLQQHSSIMHFKGIQIAVECDANCYWYFDRDLVAGILVNALNNAYNYTQDQIRVSAIIIDNTLELRVEDNGKGYASSMLQSNELGVSKGVNFSSGSTGLGFYFSSQVAQLHKNGARHGTLTIENGGTLGGGCFVVNLP